MLPAAAGAAVTLPFGGAYQLQYAPDVAAAFIAAARSEGAKGRRWRTSAGETVRVEQVVAAIEAAAPGARIDHEPVVLPFPSATGGGRMPSPLEDGVTGTRSPASACCSSAASSRSDPFGGAAPPRSAEDERGH